MNKLSSFLMIPLTLTVFGCSHSLNGTIYDRNLSKTEFSYPHVQYGHIESVQAIDEKGTDAGEEKRDEKIITPTEGAAALSTSTLGRSVALSNEKPLNSDQENEQARLAQLEKQSRSKTRDNLPENAHSITQQIKALGIADIHCNDGKNCQASAESAPVVIELIPANVMLKVRLDNGKDYAFKYQPTSTWNPKPADRVKVFFGEIQAEQTARVLRIEQDNVNTQPVNSPGNTQP